MENPYRGVLHESALLLITPLPDFCAWAIWYSIFHIFGYYLGDSGQYVLISTSIALRIGFGYTHWAWGTFEMALLYVTSSAGHPAITSRLLPLNTVVYNVVAKFQPVIVRYFQFRETDENNLGIITGNNTSLTAFLVVTLTLPAIRALWAYMGWILVALVSTGLVTFLPSVRQFVLVRVTGKLVLGVIKWLIRIFLYNINTTTAAAHRYARKIEQWEHGRATVSMKALSSLRYSILNPQAREIRILRLRQRTSRPEIECDFIQVSVDEAPPFEAVSYTWGGETFSEIIVVDGCRLAVSPTVCKWLRYRRSFFSEAYLWIDAVCIDQSNDHEKASQIPLMRDIYSRAHRTWVWLAHPTEVDDSHGARSLIMTLCHLSISGASAANIQYVVTTDQRMGSVSRLLARNYFHRMWIVQEVALAQRVHVSYGNATMDWMALEQCAKVLLNSQLMGSMHRTSDMANKFSLTSQSIPSRHMANIMGISRLRESFRKGEQLDILFALARMADFAATIPHDNIFGLLGMIDQVPSYLAQLDYQEPVERLFARTTRHLVHEESTTSLLQLAGSGFSSRHELPSWVPDFTQGYLGRRRAFVAVSKLRSPVPNPDLDAKSTGALWNVLRVQHRVLDTIKVVQNAEFLPFTSMDAVWRHDAQDDWTTGSTSPYKPDPNLPDLFKQHFQLFLAWHDGAVALAQAEPRFGEHYPGDKTETMLRTLCSNIPELTGESENQVGALDRYKMVMGITKIICQIYQSPIADNPEAVNEALLRHFQLTPLQWVSIIDPEMNKFFYWMGASAFGKRFCVLESGRIGMVPPGARTGDVVSYIRGQTIPFILRASEKHDGFTELVGGCYVHGVSDVPAIPDGGPWSEVSII